MELADKKLEITIGLFLLGGIIAWLVIPMSFQDTTIILEGGGGGAPVSCLPSGGLVLAQNLTDLCDVTIISPTTNQIIKYNGSQWINVSQVIITTNATCTNLGTGTFICASSANNIINFKSLVELNGIDITNSSTEIFIRNTGVLSANAGSGISVNQTTGNVLITNTLPENTICDNVSNTTGKTIHVIGSNCTAKTMKAGSGLAITNDSSSITYINQFPESTECFDSTATGLSIITNTTNADCYFKTFLNGTSILITGNTTHIIITNTAPDNTVCANVGSATAIYKDGECNFKTLVGSPDISIINTTNTVVIDYNGTHVTSLTSDDTATLSYSSSTGAITTTPVLKKLCEFTGVGGETSITCTFSSSQQVFYAQVHFNSTVTNTQWALRFNNDTGANYAVRSASNGGADASSTGRTSFFSNTITASVMNSYMIECHDHMNTFEKWCNGDITTMVSGAGTAPARTELYGKWANRTTDITSINLTRIASTGILNAGSHIIVWGYS